VTHGGVGELRFRFLHTYVVVPDVAPGTYTVRSARYQYRVLDIAEREVAVYDWHPEGISPVRTPHLHVPAAGAITLAQRPGTPRADAKTYLGRLHFPTAGITLEDILELLIREFGVDPVRSDWEAVLQANREVTDRGRTE